ncbi:MAG TPA: hypothetical protein DCL76_02880 [Chloroflexi bacterium]|nr:hypothetical protein [Chloroflexota bacterium]|tara:strand:- start:475 stop:1446 length:972 start_codon:yes stop_codon:yes gene_type:complete
MKINKINPSLLSFILAITIFITSCTTNKSTYKVALIAPFTGLYREIGYQAITGSQIAIRNYNQSKPKYLPQLELVAFDDAGDPVKAAEQAQNILTDKQIVAVVGHWLDETTSAAANIYKHSKLIVISTSSEPSRIPGSQQWFFSLYPTSETIYSKMESLSKKHNIPNICNCDLYSGLNLLNTITDETHIDNPSAIGGTLWSLNTFQELVGSDSHKTIFLSPIPNPLVDTSTNKVFTEKHRSLYPDRSDPNLIALHAFEAINIITHSISQSKSIDNDSIGKSLSNIDYTGTIGKIQFNKEGRWKDPQLITYTWNNKHLSLWQTK